MANEQNLKPVRTKKEARERGRAGGIASGKSRAIAKTFKQAINDTVTDKDMELMIKAMMKAAKNGNTKAFEVLRDTRGEKPKEEIEVKEVESSWFK